LKAIKTVRIPSEGFFPIPCIPQKFCMEEFSDVLFLIIPSRGISAEFYTEFDGIVYLVYTPYTAF